MKSCPPGRAIAYQDKSTVLRGRVNGELTGSADFLGNYARASGRAGEIEAIVSDRLYGFTTQGGDVHEWQPNC